MGTEILDITKKYSQEFNTKDKKWQEEKTRSIVLCRVQKARKNKKRKALRKWSNGKEDNKKLLQERYRYRQLMLRKNGIKNNGRTKKKAEYAYDRW